MAQIIVCHICGSRDADIICTACGRPVCKEHTGQDDVCEMCWADYDGYIDAHAEDMDGDFDSGMASAGLGVDEDYGCFGGDEW